MMSSQNAARDYTSFRAIEGFHPGAIVNTGVVPPATIPNLPPKKTVAPPIRGGGGSGDMSFGFGGGGISGIGLDFSPTININAGLISSPASLGQEIIDAILAAQRNSGVVFAPAT
jgi:hypothetical protein